MLDSKIKSVPIRDFLFSGISHRKRTHPAGFFPPNNTKVAFQMPRKAHSVKRPQSKTHRNRVDLSFLKEGFLQESTVKDESKLIPAVVLRSLNRLINASRLSMDSNMSQRFAIESITTFTKERPTTSVVTQRKPLEQSCVSTTPKLRPCTGRKKTEKINIFIKCPAIEDPNCK